MKKYKKVPSPALSVKYYDAKTNTLLFSVDNRTSISVGELFSEHSVSHMAKSYFKTEDKFPESLKIMVVGTYELRDTE